LKCGEWVRVKYGPLQGIEGILVRKKNLYRLVLSVEILGKAASVEIDAFVIERMNYAASKIARFSTKFTNYQAPPSLRN